MRALVGVGLVGVALVSAAACSSSSSGGASPTGDSGSPGPGTGDAGKSLSGAVVDWTSPSAAKNFDVTQYPPLEGVEVCAYGNSAIPCVTTDASGKYTLPGVATGATLSFKKTGYQSTLYGTFFPSGVTILMSTTATYDSWTTQAGGTPDATKGTILFGGGSFNALPGSVYSEPFNTNTWHYVGGYSLTISPAATVGPVYTSASWAPDPALTSATSAGWGFFQAAPGKYTITASDPTLDCTGTTVTVVAGFATTYVGIQCAVPDGGTSPGDASSDAAGSEASAPADASADGG
jgi:hypothetical protein